MNSSVDTHAVNDNFVIVSHRRKAKIKEKRVENDVKLEVEEEIETFTVEYCHYFAKTLTKGKKNDHAMHNACLDDIIIDYKNIILDEFGIELTLVIVWSDNAPHQYRCRQNFIRIASVSERHEAITIIHCLAAVSNFKGVWDESGK